MVGCSSRKVLELALREALSLGHNYIGPEHVLLGLVRENEGVAARILLDFDADAEKVRNQIIRMLSGPGQPRTVITGAVTGGTGAADTSWLGGTEDVLASLADEIRGKLGREPDAGDLLLALACAPDTIPGQALGELGVDLDALWRMIKNARAQVTRAQTAVSPAVLGEITRRLGIPRTDDPAPSQNQ